MDKIEEKIKRINNPADENFETMESEPDENDFSFGLPTERALDPENQKKENNNKKTVNFEVADEKQKQIIPEENKVLGIHFKQWSKFICIICIIMIIILCIVVETIDDYKNSRGYKDETLGN